ncbi:PREDICTED: cell wall protein DAN4 isoform X2 [Dinoponera quadriceps]|uniref:Cell wall protein DAN4 isoform X2 n=1 Tax=Dinoponera quadriceps TaxID=609295 RepID=A0A6P3XWR7_DINQU|nr:PREDICTED: cell wall protein DAN4 isoform X2 [Dinoponera quadriceps]
MSDHVVKSTCELSAYVTAGVMADSERDSASSSGGDEDSRSGLHSPSASEDSVEVQVTPISLRNKRKLAEPRKIQEPSTAPLKKRRFHQIEETVVDDESRPMSTPSPFRPWIIPRTSNETSKTSTTTLTMTVSDTTTSTTTSTTPSTNTAPEEINGQLLAETDRRNHEENGHVNHTTDKTTIRRLQKTLQRLEESTTHNRSVVLSRRESRQRLESPPQTPIPSASPVALKHPRLQEEPLSLVMRDEAPRVPLHPAVSGSYEKSPSYMMEHLLASSTTTTTTTTTSPLQSHRNHRDHSSPPQGGGPHQRLHAAPTAGVISSTSSSSSPSHASSTRHLHQNNGGGQQRNYKNMTRERRIEANARERTRVHTISAAFDTLRRAIPAYSHNQKLSKLSVLRIACSYIVTLTKICEMFEGDAASGASLATCVDQVSRTIQTEGKLRKRKDD